MLLAKFPCQNKQTFPQAIKQTKKIWGFHGRQEPPPSNFRPAGRTQTADISSLWLSVCGQLPVSGDLSSIPANWVAQVCLPIFLLSVFSRYKCWRGRSLPNFLVDPQASGQTSAQRDTHRNSKWLHLIPTIALQPTKRHTCTNVQMPALTILTN